MNRRSFIATLTAIAGAVLAKIKAPAGETIIQGPVFKWIRSGPPGRHTYRQLTGMVEMSGKHYYFTKDATYICDNTGLYRLTEWRSHARKALTNPSQ